jgi:N-acetyl-gamma-glutamyl-phosphate reductase
MFPDTASTIAIGIIGGAGYTGGELLRILLHHPQAHISFVHSTSNAGKPVASVHTDVLGDTDLHFTGEISLHDVDVLFLCVGHGEATKFLAANKIPPHIRVIDLSQDFRYAEAEQWLYGLPELNRDRIFTAHADGFSIANPGCFATCIQLGILPMASAGLLPEEIHITGVTGSTGAGRALAETSHFSWRTGNISVYKAFEHQHLREIRASMRTLQPSFDKTSHLYFVPMRGSFTRGILVSTHFKCTENIATVRSLYEEYYAPHPFTHLTDASPDVKQVVNTNKCFIALEKHGAMLHVVSVLDNLLKGASGQAVQNMNLLFGIPETAGLGLKGVGF